MTKLEQYFLEIPDNRRPAGRRYALSKLLLAFTLGVMSGYQGCRELARFMKYNRDELIAYIQWERADSWKDSLANFSNKMDKLAKLL